MTALELLEELNIPVMESGHEHCRPGWVQIDCPYCTPDSNHWRLGINISKAYGNCWLCGPVRFTDAVIQITGKSYRLLKPLLGDLDKGRPEASLPKKKGKLILPYGTGPLLKSHRKYLKDKRHLDPDELVKLWSIGGIGPAPKLAWRIFIPFIFEGQIISWLTRKLDDKGLRYRSAEVDQEVYSHKDFLYGEDYARNSVIVVEGPIDAWTIGPGAVATCGTGINRLQVARIAKYPVRAICFDNEPEAQKRARKLCDELEVMPGETHNILLSGKDANSSPRREIRKLRRLYFGHYESNLT